MTREEGRAITCALLNGIDLAPTGRVGAELIDRLCAAHRFAGAAQPGTWLAHIVEKAHGHVTFDEAEMALMHEWLAECCL